MIVDEKPKFTALNNYAVCPHFESEFCQLPTNHFHVLIDSAIDVETIKPTIHFFVVLCVFTTFRYLFSTSTSVEFIGDTFSKLQLALTLITDLETKLIPLIYASDFPWQQRQKTAKRSAINSGISKTLARSTSFVPQKTIHFFVCSTFSSKTQTDQFSRVEKSRNFEKSRNNFK